MTAVSLSTYFITSYDSMKIGLITMITSIAVGEAIMIPGIVLIFKRKKFIRKAINEYNKAHPYNPVIIEVGSVYLSPFVARGGGGLGLTAVF